MNLERALSIDGWMNDTELRWLAEQAQKSKVIYEVGCYYGRSTRALADNSPSDAIVFAVDPWEGDYYKTDDNVLMTMTQDHFNKFKQNLEPYIEEGKVKPLRYKFKNITLRMDPSMVFLDGDHRYKEVRADIYHAIDAYPKILAGHDYTHPDWPGVKKAVDEIFGNSVHTLESIWWVELQA